MTFDLWQLEKERLGPFLIERTPWAVLDELADVIAAIGRELDDAYEQIALQVWVHRTAQVASSAVLTPPCILDEGAQVRPFAYLRGATYVGRHAVVGHAVELKNTVLMEGAQAAHFNYVGDSVLGAYAHLGAGAIVSNLRQDKSLVLVQIEGIRYPTNRRKMGALVGDFAEVGCNAVLNPGTVLARGAVVRPMASIKGYIAAK